MSIDNALRPNITNPQFDPQTAPTTAPTTGPSEKVTSPLAPSLPTDLGAGLAAMALGTPDTAATASPVQTTALTEASEKAILHQVDKQVAGGIQSLRNMAQAENPSPTQALAQITQCYTAATELATLSEIDAEVPSVVAHALLQNDTAVAQLGGDGATELAEACKDKISQLFNAVDSHDIEEAQAFLTGLRDQLKASNALDDDGAALLRSMTHLAASKMEDIATGTMADIGHDFGLADAENALEEAIENSTQAYQNLNVNTQNRDELFSVNIANLFNENIDGDISDANHRVEWSGDQVQAMQGDIDKADRQVAEAKTQTFVALAGRSEIRLQDEVNTLLADELTALSQGTGSMSLAEISKNIDESPLLTDTMRTECQRGVEAFSQATLSTIDDKLANDVKDLHIGSGEGGRPTIEAGNLEARASQLRQDIMATTLAGHGQEEALAKLDKVMTALNTERADGLKQIFANHEGGALSTSQCATLNTLLKFEGVAYDPMALEQIEHFGQGLGAQLDIISQGLDANATTAQKLDAARSVDMVFMDNPLMGDTALTMKESILGEGHEALPTMHAEHEAICAKSEAFAAVGTTKAFSTALDAIGKEAGCDKHHAAAISMKELFANGLGSSSKVQTAALMLLHAAWTEQKVQLVNQDLDLDDKALDKEFKHFVKDLPPKLQHTLAKCNADISLVEDACTAGITTREQYDIATRGLEKAAFFFRGKDASTGLQAMSGALAAGQASMAEERLFILMVDDVETARNEAIAHDHVKRDDNNSTMAALRAHIGASDFGSKITDTGVLKTLGGAYIESLDTLNVEAFKVSHDEHLQDVMRAQGVTEAKKVRGETLAVSCLYADRVLTENVHDLSELDLLGMGLLHTDLDDMGALELCVKHMDWGNLTNDFAAATVLHTLYNNHCASQNIEANSQGFAAFAGQKGVPSSFNGQLDVAYGILTASVEDRQNALKGLSLHPSHTHAVGNRHVDFEQMKISTSVIRHGTDVHEKDSVGKAHSREFTRLLKDYTSHTGSGSDLTAMKDQMKYIINTYRPKMEAVLSLRDAGKASVADHMERLDKKVFASKPNVGTDFHAAVHSAVRSETMGVLNAGKNIREANRDMGGVLAKETGMHSSFDSNKRGVRGFALRHLSTIADRIRTRIILKPDAAQAVPMKALQTSLLRAFQSSGAKTYGAFGQVYEGQLQAVNGAIGQTDICKTIAQELVALGVKEEIADVRARGLLVGMEKAMPRLLRATVSQVDAQNLEKQLQLASNGKRTKLQVRETLCADAANRVLDNLGAGEAVVISSSLKVTLVSSKAVDGVGVSGGLSRELKESMVLTHNADDKPEITLSNSALSNFSLSASFAGLTAKGTASGVGTHGMRLTFKDNGDCANFMKSLFSGGGKPEDLSCLNEVHFLDEKGLGMGVLLKEDIVGTFNSVTGLSLPSALRLNAMASAQGSVTMSHESHRHGETVKMQSNFQVGLSASAGFGGAKKGQIMAKRVVGGAMNVGPNVRTLGLNSATRGFEAQIQCSGTNTVEIDYATSRGKTLNGENVRIMKDAHSSTSASFRAADGNSQALAKDYMKKMHVPESAAKEASAWLADNKPGMFTIEVRKDVKHSAIAHKSETEAMAALTHDSNFTFGGVIIKTSKAAFSTRHLGLGDKVTLRAGTDGSTNKAVKFMGNMGKEARANAVPKDTTVDNIQQPLDPHADMDLADLVAEPPTSIRENS